MALRSRTFSRRSFSATGITKRQLFVIGGVKTSPVPPTARADGQMGETPIVRVTVVAGILAHRILAHRRNADATGRPDADPRHDLRVRPRRRAVGSGAALRQPRARYLG